MAEFNFTTLMLIILQLGVAFSTDLSSSKHALPKRFVERVGKSALLALTKDVTEKYKPIDLAKGFPDFNPPNDFKSILEKITHSGDYSLNQYTRELGHPRLVHALAQLYSARLSRTVDPYSNIMITVGGIHALRYAIQGHTNPGDEWIVFEPFYDYYPPIIKSALGIVKYVPLKLEKTGDKVFASDYKFDRDELASLFNEKTKGIIVNTPHNPLGKVFTRDELEFIADLAGEWDVIVLADEVYEFFVFDNSEHISIASLPGMWERTITIGSGGKCFSATGIRVGWAYGGVEVMKNVQSVQMILNLPSPTINQEAVARMFEEEIQKFGTTNSYLSTFKDVVQEKRDVLVEAFQEAGLTPIIPQGGYFVVANWTSLENSIDVKSEPGVSRGIAFVRWIIEHFRIQGILLTPFYKDDNPDAGEEAIRFCMVKKAETLSQAVENMREWSATRY